MTDAAPAPERRIVLITRPREDSARTAALVEARGFVPLIAPVMQVWQFSPQIPRRVQAVLVASGNALAGLPVLDVPLLAVGDATAARARAAGWTRVESAGRDAEALAELAGQRLDPRGDPLLLPSGRGQGNRLAAALRAQKFAVIRRVTYAAGPVECFPPAAEAALRSGDVHAALFLSGETAAAFVRRLPPALRDALGNVLALVIGKAAGDALRPLPWRQVRLARAPTLDEVLALL